MGMSLVTRDSDIRKVLIDLLRTEFCHEDDLIVEELGCNAARIDVAVINGSLHAFEIKSDSDSLHRLPAQIIAYQGVYDYVTLVCGRKLIEKAVAIVPETWGLMVAELHNGMVSLSEGRVVQRNHAQDPWRSQTC